jgi:hypothetical protein
VDTRIVGRAELEIYFTHFSKQDGAEDQDPAADASLSAGIESPGGQ